MINTKKILAFVPLFFLVSSCQAIGDIFSAGVWIGLTIAVIIIIVLVAIFGRKK